MTCFWRFKSDVATHFNLTIFHSCDGLKRGVWHNGHRLIRYLHRMLVNKSINHFWFQPVRNKEERKMQSHNLELVVTGLLG